MSVVIDGFGGAYRFLSNFWEAPLEARYPKHLGYNDGVLRFRTVEHAFQSSKFLDPETRAMVRNAKTAGEAKRLGRKFQSRKDWDDVKLAVMEHFVEAKFLQHADLAERLVATRPAELVEGNPWGDTYWGVSGGVGENHLGKILMALRDRLAKGER